MALSKRQRRKLRLAKLQKQTAVSQSPEAQPSTTTSKVSPFKWGLLLGSFVFFALISFTVYSYFTPGYFDDFAQCLSDKGAVVYGASWCEYTDHQKAMFGKSKKFLNYEDYSDYPSDQGKIERTPTWVINGHVYKNIQSLEFLSQQTGCPIS